MNSNFDRQDWDHWFLDLARFYSTRSKDESTKVGCVLVSSDKTVVASGYNGLPRRADDDVPARLLRPEKYLWFEHAERNAIYNSAKNGVALDGVTAYVTLCPCMDCARGLVQSGIRRVVTYKEINKDILDRYVTQFVKVEELFKECGVSLEYIS